MKIFIVAAAAWAAGALLGYFVARLAYKHLRKRLRTLRQERKPPKKKMGTMDRILVLEAVFLVAYTVADLVVFWHTGSEPATLRVRRVRPGKRRHGLDQDQQGQGGGGRRNERERHPAAPGGTARGHRRTTGRGPVRRYKQT